ncbi:hypothetical protein OIE13_16405 [Streptosporangium sp. NBC_01810]|uniref:hypothetical protein n=1 Tax=Streptosporangium sp. NBC_01810 TaxID=2975951 RepID=UPI002DD84203|nr:hypothetical protein [Streptosporangium sp. NBC_01810]WSA29317.1 hypothetical protein OIE13_16405 [Streptosporangium sp. NBC_01810]
MRVRSRLLAVDLRATRAGRSVTAPTPSPLLGREATFLTIETAIKGMRPDVGKLRELVGGAISSIGRRDGLRSVVSTAVQPVVQPVVPGGAGAP